MFTRFVFNEVSYFGWGARKNLIDEIKNRKYKKALLVTGSNLVKLGVTNKVTNLLDANNISYELYSDVITNPTITNVKKGLRIANKFHVDYIIAVGGGSVIDTAKAIGIISTNPEFKDVKSLIGITNTKNKSLPIIALPTTSGSGSETSINCEIVDEEEKVKLVSMDPNNIPMLSIVDTELMSAMPVTTMAETGLNALAHAIECYLTKDHNEISDMFALKAINLIYNNLEKAITRDKVAMEKIAMAQYLAGMGFSNVGLGLVHSMANQLSAMYDISHGLASAVLLPYVMEFNIEGSEDRYVDIARTIGLEIEGTNDTIAYKLIDSIKDLASRLNVPMRISEIGGKIKDIEQLSVKSLADPCTLANPRKVDLADIMYLFNKSL